MTAQIPFDLNLAQWELWSVPVAGFICTGLVLMGGRWILARRRQPLAVTDTHIPYTALGSPKRRQTPRGRGAPSRILILDKNGPKEPYSGWVVNRSIGGLCVNLVQPVEEGSILSVRPANDPQDDVWYEVLVKYCRVTESGWEFGCVFQGHGGSHTMFNFS